MSIISEIKKAFKIVKKIKEVKTYFDTHVIDKDLHKDIAEIREILDRMAARVAVFKGIWDLLK